MDKHRFVHHLESQALMSRGWRTNKKSSVQIFLLSLLFISTQPKQFESMRPPKQDRQLITKTKVLILSLRGRLLSLQCSIYQTWNEISVSTFQSSNQLTGHSFSMDSRASCSRADSSAAFCSGRLRRLEHRCSALAEHHCKNKTSRTFIVPAFLSTSLFSESETPCAPTFLSSFSASYCSDPQSAIKLNSRDIPSAWR